MTIAATPVAAPLPAVQLEQLAPVLQQLTEVLTALIPLLQAQGAATSGPATTGAAEAGAAQLAGGGDTVADATGGSCGCAGMAGAATGAATVGLAPAAASSGGGAGAAPPAFVSGGGAAAAPIETSEPDPPVAGSKGQQAVELARKELGKPYRFGAAGPDAYDCSGLVLAIYKQLGVDLPHHAADQANRGTAVDKADLQPGDLVFFDAHDGAGIHHVGMYIGDGKMIHAPKTGDVVKVSDIGSGYYARQFAGARRFA